MIFRVFFAWIFLGLTASTPLSLRQQDGYGNIGYEYDVKHPGGNSRVHVRTGNNNRNGNYYPYAGGPHHKPYEYGSPYDSAHHKPLRGQFNGRVPVYEEHSGYSRPALIEALPSDHLFSTHGRSGYVYHPEQTGISQEILDAELFSAGKVSPAVDYSSPPIVQQIVDDSSDIPSSPPIVQQVAVDEPSDKILIDRVGPVPSSPIIQQTSDDIPINFDKYPDSQIVSQLPLDDKSPPIILEQSHDQQIPIDQVLLDYPSKSEEIPIISQQPFENKPLYDPVSKTAPAIKSIPTHSELPLIQETVDPTSIKAPAIKSVPILPATPLSQQTVIDVSPPKDIVSSKKGGIILQKPLDDQPVISQVTENIPSIKSVPKHSDIPVVQQALLDAPPVILSEPKYGQQEFIEDSSVEYNPVLVTQQQTLVDADEILEEPIVQTSIDPHLSQISDSSIEPSLTGSKYPPPRPLFIDEPKYRFIPVGQPYEKISHSTEIVHGPPHHLYGPPAAHPHKYTKPSYQYFIKSPPVSPSVKYPYPKKPFATDIAFVKNPPLSHSLKLPPQSHAPVFLDFPHTKPPPKYHSVKLPPQKTLLIDPPPPPISHSVKFPPQKTLLLDYPPPPVSHSVKLPPQKTLLIDPPPPSVSHSVKLPPQKTLLIDPPPPPVSHSVKLPPQTQEPILVDLSHTKNPPKPHSVKLPPQEVLLIDPPPPPITHSIKLPPQTQEPVLVDLSHTKIPPKPHSVKLPPQEVLLIDPPPPPITHSVKLPPQTQEPIILDLSHTKTPPKPHSVKLPPQEVLLIDPPPPPITHSVKLPPHPQEPLLIDTPPAITHSVKLPPQKPHSVKLPPFLGQGIKQPYPPSVKHPNTATLIDSPHVKGPPAVLYDGPSEIIHSPITHSVVPNADTLENDSPHVSLDSSPFNGSPHEEPPLPNRAPVSHAVLLPVISSAKPKVDTDELKKLTPAIPEIDLKKAELETTGPAFVPNLFAAVPLGHDDPSSLSNVNTPVSHAVRLPLPKSTTAPLPVSEALVSGPVNPSYSLRSPISHHQPSHSVRLNAPGHRNSRRPFSRGVQDISFGAPKRGENNFGGTSKEDFPAFPVKSALEQDDPVADKVSDLSRNFSPGGGYINSGGQPEENEPSKPPSIEEAKLEIDRVNSEIGLSFGDRIPPRSRRYH